MAKVEIGLTTQGAQQQLTALYSRIGEVSKQLDSLVQSAAQIGSKLGASFAGAKIGDGLRTSLVGAQRELENFSVAIDKNFQGVAAKISSRIQGAFSGFGLNASTVFGSQFATLAKNLASTSAETQKYAKSQVQVLQQAGLLSTETTRQIQQVAALAKAYGTGIITLEQFRKKIIEIKDAQQTTIAAKSFNAPINFGAVTQAAETARAIETGNALKSLTSQQASTQGLLFDPNAKGASQFFDRINKSAQDTQTRVDRFFLGIDEAAKVGKQRVDATTNNFFSEINKAARLGQAQQLGNAFSTISAPPKPNNSGLIIDPNALQAHVANLTKIQNASKLAEEATTRFGLGLREISRVAQLSYGPLSGIAFRITTFSELYKTLPLLAAGAALIGGLGEAFTHAVREGEAFEKFNAQLDGSLKTVGSGVGETRQQIEGLVDSIKSVSLAPIEQIRQGAIALLSFPGIAGNVFDRTLRAATDIAAVFGDDIPSAVRRFGRALEDPAQNLSALTRLGITFNSVEKEQIKILEGTGQLQSAQGEVLSKIESHFKGAAEAAGKNTFAGAVNDLHNSLRDLFETIGVKSGLLDNLRRSMEGIAKALHDPAIQDAGKSLGRAFSTITGSGALAGGAQFAARHIDSEVVAGGGLLAGKVIQSTIGLIFGKPATALEASATEMGLAGKALLGAAGSLEGAALTLKGESVAGAAGAAGIGAAGAAVGEAGVLATITAVSGYVFLFLPIIIAAAGLAYEYFKGRETTDDRVKEALDLQNRAKGGPTLDHNDLSLKQVFGLASIPNSTADVNNLVLEKLKPDFASIRAHLASIDAINQQISHATTGAQKNDLTAQRNAEIGTLNAITKSVEKAGPAARGQLGTVFREHQDTLDAQAKAQADAKAKEAADQAKRNLQNQVDALGAISATYDKLGNEAQKRKDAELLITAAIRNQSTALDANLKAEFGTTAIRLKRGLEFERPENKLQSNIQREQFSAGIKFNEGNAIGEAQAKLEALNKALGEGAVLLPKEQAAFLRYGTVLKSVSADSANLVRQSLQLAQVQKEIERVTTLSTAVSTVDDKTSQLQAQLDLLTKTKQERQAAVEFTKIENDLQAKGVDLTGAQADALRRIIELQGQAGAIIQQDDIAAKELGDTFKSTFDSLENVFNTLTDAIGKHSAKATEEINKQLRSQLLKIPADLEKEFVKLAISNPIQNLLFGQGKDKLPTLGSVYDHLTGKPQQEAQDKLSEGSAIAKAFTDQLKQQLDHLQVNASNVYITASGQSSSTGSGDGWQIDSSGSLIPSGGLSQGTNQFQVDPGNISGFFDQSQLSGASGGSAAPFNTYTNPIGDVSANNSTSQALDSTTKAVQPFIGAIDKATNGLGSFAISILKSASGVLDFISSLGSGGGGGGLGFLGSLFGSGAGAAAGAEGASAAVDSGAGALDALAAAQYGMTFFARGGTIVKKPSQFNMGDGRKGIMGENGPEAIMPLTRTSTGELGVHAGGVSGGSNGDTHFPITIHNTNGSKVTAHKDGNHGLRIMVETAIQDSIEQGGKVDQSIQKNYHIARKQKPR